jgi:hypothetical protein
MGWVIDKRWDLQRRVRRGGQAAIWLTWDRRDERWVITKRYDVRDGHHDREVIQRFRHEAERVRSVGASSPHVIEVLDYGENDGHGVPDTTMTAGILGTAHYIAPERWRGERGGHPADVYSAAVVAYELLCGRRPYEGQSAERVLQETLAGGPPVPTTLNPRLPPVLDAVLLRGLAAEPDQRFATAKEFSDALGVAMGAYQPAEDSVAAADAARAAERTELLNAQERTAVTHQVKRAGLARTLTYPARIVDAMARRLTPDELADRRDAVRLYAGVLAMMVALVSGLVLLYVWMLVSGTVVPVLTAIGNVLGWLLAAAGDLIGLLPGSDWLWLGGLALAAAGVFGVRRHGVRVVVVPVVALLLGVTLVFGLPEMLKPRDESGQAQATSKKKRAFAKSRMAVRRALLREQERWDAHYRRSGNRSARANTRRNIRWARGLARNAKYGHAGRRQVALARKWLRTWQRQRRSIARAGAW